MTKLKIGKLYKLKQNPKEKDWEINGNNYIVSMTIPGFFDAIPKHPIMYIGSKRINGLHDLYVFLTPKLVFTFHKNFLNDLKEI